MDSNEEDLIEKIDRNCREIYNFTKIAKDFSYSECIDWLNDKDYLLFNLEKQIAEFGKGLERNEVFRRKLFALEEMKEFLKRIREKTLAKSMKKEGLNIISFYNSI